MYRNFCASLGLATTLILATFTAAAAADIKIGDLVIHNPTLRATAPGAKVGAGYLTITNQGQSDERLIVGNAKFAARTEIHEMKMVDQVMKMRQMENGLEIPAGTSVQLKPGGNHIMFMKLSGPLKVGETQKATLIFENAGEVELSFETKSIGEDHEDEASEQLAR